MNQQHKNAGQVVLRSLVSADFQSKLSTSLPKGIDQDRFTRVTITALQKNPDVLQGDRNSLYLAVLACAQAGLEPDGKEAALVRFGPEVQFMPMVGGIIKRLGACGITADTQVVHANDLFDVEFGDAPAITHKPPKLGQERGAMIGAYAILRGPNGSVWREVMDAAQIEAVKNQSRAKNGLLWTKFESEAWRKTVLRRCAKRVAMPLDVLAERTLAADDASFDMNESITPAPGPESDPTVVAEQQLDRAADEPKRPAGLAAVVATPSSPEDIF